MGLKVGREFVVGHPSTLKEAILPNAAAVGSIVLPALIYAAINRGGEGAHGWGIPLATDILFCHVIQSLVSYWTPAS